MVSDWHHFDEEQDPDPDAHQSDKRDPDPYHRDADPQHWF
jgi:hypothetical protein